MCTSVSIQYIRERRLCTCRLSILSIPFLQVREVSDAERALTSEMEVGISETHQVFVEVRVSIDPVKTVTRRTNLSEPCHAVQCRRVLDIRRASVR